MTRSLPYKDRSKAGSRERKSGVEKNTLYEVKVVGWIQKKVKAMEITLL